MCTHSTEQKTIIEALKIIINTCNDAKDCGSCPFRASELNSTYSCYFEENPTPFDWEINESISWKAFE